MPMQKTLGRGPAASSQLALAAILSLALTMTTQETDANTLPSTKVKVIVAAPSQEVAPVSEQTARLDKAMNALAPREAALYRAIFQAQQNEDLERARGLIARLTDTRLLGHVLADRLSRNKNVTGQELVKWLEVYPALPQAPAIYAKAKKLGVANPPKPKTPDAWQGASEVDGAANFSPELVVESTAPQSENKSLAKAVQKALKKGDPWAARNLLIEAQASRKLTGTFAFDLEAMVASAFFTAGEREQATALSNAAAGANQPMGLWIRGLIAWENNDTATARLMFTRLAAHPALSSTNRAAANFWAYRALSREGRKAEAKNYLEAAASVPRSFYGLLAGQLMGKNPVETLSLSDKSGVWGRTHQTVLSAHPVGWRALALIQIGQNDLAEAELRLFNPQGETALQKAMRALADYVPMPALAVQLANLSKNRGGFDTAFYPLPPWQPKEGFVVDRALLFALARHESLFDPTAVSRKGAQGLMQIMPDTARRIADDDHHEKSMLLDPAYNMGLGQKYVQHLAEQPQIRGNLLLLLAAYNAGPAKAMNWANGKDGTDPLLFLESMPSRETRGYVARVLPHYWAYRARLGRSTASLKQMAEGKWPSVSVNEDKPLHVAQAQ